MPVVAGDRGLAGVDAVIDKDLAAQRLATAVGADALVLVTDSDDGDARLRHAAAARDRTSDASTRPASTSPTASSPTAAWGRRSAPRCGSSTRAAASR